VKAALHCLDKGKKACRSPPWVFGFGEKLKS
jgi:hypothetical protein